MSDIVLTKPKNLADSIILAEVHKNLDWIDTTSEVCVHNVQNMQKEGLIEQFRFYDLEIKVNGSWYKRP
jgi:hypothetical protein